ncbi:MAG TPA: radical SAM family heme chaperone HemW [Geminicoccaceae bacterium]|nr:radical SAM family heme chaperone HemW [Geminicoccus sp.]HMU52839.1 radical SAM family heme chaperone HemW [Geminicoccaceae bacterium]
MHGEVGADRCVDDAGFALYVHWPFCRAKCPYCDFNSHVRDGVDHGRWRRALLAELDRLAAETPGRALDSIFFGGGTPSLMAPETVAAVIDRARTHWPAASPEITLEANPTSVEAGRLRAFRDAGVNRVSLGVQALDDASLAALGREHSAAEALAAVELAGSLFERFSFDLIYARPGQTAAAWAGELGCALGFAGGHLSVYQLTIEPGTRFWGLQQRGRLRLPDDDVQGELYELTQDVLGQAGLAAYEISNHAAPGEACRHNLVYWRSGDWLGVGPGGHGRLGLGGDRLATEAVRLPEAWLRQVETKGHGEKPRLALSAEDRLTELLLMGLRLVEGVPVARIEALAGRPLEQAVDRRALRRLGDAGLVATHGGRLAATAAGRQRLSSILAALLA